MGDVQVANFKISVQFIISTQHTVNIHSHVVLRGTIVSDTVKLFELGAVCERRAAGAVCAKGVAEA